MSANLSTLNTTQAIGQHTAHQLTGHSLATHHTYSQYIPTSHTLLCVYIDNQVKNTKEVRLTQE